MPYVSAYFKTAYSSIVGLPVFDLKFTFDGRTCSDDDIPALLGMENDDMIEAYLHSLSDRVWTDSNLYIHCDRSCKRTTERPTDTKLLVSIE